MSKEAQRDAVTGEARGSEGLRVRPFEASREVWNRLVGSFSGATIYHSDRWIELLSRSYRLGFSLAAVEKGPEIRAACVLARSKSPLAGRFISLPFSDSCLPLARDEEASNDLLQGLAADQRFRSGCEIRGVAAPPPWETLSCFAGWTLDLTQPLRAIERGLHKNFRRNVRRAAHLGARIERGRGAEHVERFYALQLETRRRLGLPPQPLRMFRLAREIFADDGELDLWLASLGGSDVAGVILLRYRDRVYYKWGARRVPAPSGINHLVFWTVIEEFTGKVASFDLGRTDVRNEGLSRFKRELGASAAPLPYSYFPKPPRHPSSEVLSGPRRILSRLWRHLPLPATRILGGAIYGYLT